MNFNIVNDEALGYGKINPEFQGNLKSLQHKWIKKKKELDEVSYQFAEMIVDEITKLNVL